MIKGRVEEYANFGEHIFYIQLDNTDALYGCGQLYYVRTVPDGNCTIRRKTTHIFQTSGSCFMANWESLILPYDICI
jgi:hypothetical protein